MTALSNYAENKILDHALGTTSWTMPVQNYVALYTSDPTDADVGTEVSGSGYARQAADFAAAASGASFNSADLEFTAVGGNWGTITHWGIRDALTSGNLLIHGAFSISRTINNGDTLLIATGDLDITAADVEGGGGGGGGDASAANQTTEIARLTSILADTSAILTKIIAAPATEATLATIEGVGTDEHDATAGAKKALVVDEAGIPLVIASAANQTTEIARLTSILADTSDYLALFGLLADAAWDGTGNPGSALALWRATHDLLVEIEANGGGGGGGDASAANQVTGNTKLDTLIAKDFATQTTLAAVLAKIIAAPATEAKQDTLIAKDFATQTTLAAVLAKIIAAPATEATLTAIEAIQSGAFDATASSFGALIRDTTGQDVAFAELGPQPAAAAVPVTQPSDASFTVGGRTPRITAQMVRGSDATQYGLGDLIGNSTTAASVVPISFTSAWISGGSGRISGCRCVVTAASGTIVLPQFLLYLFRPEANVPFAAASYPADNAAFNVSAAAMKELVGVFEFLSTDWLNQAGLATAAGVNIYQGVPLRPLPSGRVRSYAPFNLASIPSQTLLGLMQVQNTWNPGAVANTFDFALDVDQD